MLSANRVKENATGVDAELTLTGAVAGYVRFSDVFTVPGAAVDDEEFNGLGCRILIEWEGGWEIDLCALDPIDGLSLHRLTKESSSSSPFGSSIYVDTLPAGAKTVSLVASAAALPNTSDVRVIYSAGTLTRVTTDRVACLLGPQRTWLWNLAVDVVDNLGTLSVNLPNGTVLPADRGLIRITVAADKTFSAKIIGVYEYVGSTSWGYTLAGGTLHNSGAAGPAMAPVDNISGSLIFTCDFSGFVDGTWQVFVRIESIGL